MTTTLTPAARVSGTIKALEWLDHPSGSKCLTDDHYSIALWANERPHPLYVRKYTTMRRSKTLEAAKAAAQADYESCILAAIHPDPEPVQVAFGDAQKYIDGMTVARIISDAHLTFRDQYYPSTFALGVGPIQSMLGLAIKNGLIATPSSAGTVSVEAGALSGEQWGRAVNAMTRILARDMDVTRCPNVSTVRDALDAALRALAGEGGQ